MISPTVHVYGGDPTRGEARTYHIVYGWYIAPTGAIEPIVGNPDGPGLALWSLYYGEDPWWTG